RKGSARRAGGKDDYAVSIPCTSFSGRCVAESLRRASRCFNFLQLPIRKESNKPAVRRPKRKRRVVCSRQHLCRHRVEPLNPQTWLFTKTCNEREAAAVGRHGKVRRRRRCASLRHIRIELRTWRRLDLESNGCGFGLMARQHNGGKRDRDQKQNGNGGDP